MPKTVYLLTPLTPPCWKWAKANIDYESTFAGGIAIEHRFLGDVLRGLADAGFVADEDFLLF